MLKLEELETILTEHCIKMSIFRKDASQKKKDSIIDSLIAAIVRSKITFEEVLECVEDINNNNVIDIRVFKNGGNINDYINPRWLNFAKSLWRQRSVGLGTPNAASGEGELMFIFLSKEISKPVKGDLMIDGEVIEIKGEGVRVNAGISGKNFRLKTLQILNKYKLKPNISYRTKLEAVEIEKIQHQEYWSNELIKIPLYEQKMFISEYLNCIDNNKHNVEELFDINLNFDKFVKYIVKTLYTVMIKDSSFDKMVILGDGTNIKIISNDNFNKNVDNGMINILSDYFRINQDANIAWYIS